LCSSVAVDGSLVVVVSSCPIIITVSPEKRGLVSRVKSGEGGNQNPDKH